jgi:flagellar biosynthesis protein FlhB
MADDDKSQDPTPHRRKQLRDEGRVAHSQDLSSAGLLLAALAVLVFAGAALVEYLAVFLVGSLSGQSWRAWLDAGAGGHGQLAVDQWGVLTSGLGRVLLPVLGLMLVAAVAVNIVQTGFLISPKKLLPDFSRINPFSGLGRITSSTSAVRMLFGLVKLASIALVAGFYLYQRRDELVSLAGLDLPQLPLALWQVCLDIGVRIGFALLTLAGLDYAWQRWKHERDARMSPQEVREELRALGGDPQLAFRRRLVRREMSKGR